MLHSFKIRSMLLILLATFARMEAKLTLQEIRTASDNVLVAVFTSDTLDVREADIGDSTAWTVNGRPAERLTRYAAQADPCDHFIYLQTGRLKEGKQYTLITPYGEKSFKFDSRKIHCESIKTNQAGYSALSKTRYANFAVWLGTGGPEQIQGTLPAYEVFSMRSGKSVLRGRLETWGPDSSSGDYVYRIDLSGVPEGGPYRIAVKGFGCSYPFGIGGEFSKKLAYTIFRAQYLQRCGCPIHKPDIRKNPCHTLVYDVDGPIGEANVIVEGTEPAFKCHGGYHDAGDADRRAYHMAHPIMNLMIYEAFPGLFEDGQYDIPGEFDSDYQILNYENAVPDIIDEAEWGTLVWEYLQNGDGSVHFGTETKGYPDPFDAPLDLDTKKYGTVKVDDRATATSAGLFMHLARLLKPYKPDRAGELALRAERSMASADSVMADPERLYYHIQRYLYTGDEADHDRIKALYTIADSLKTNLYGTPGYSLNDAKFDNPAYIWSYIIEKEKPVDPAIVDFFKSAVRAAAGRNISELKKHAYPVGNNSAKGGWGHNVKQPQYACAPMLMWSITGEQKYLDAASELMDYKLGLNPPGISYVTQLGFHQVHNPHDRESAYTKRMGLGPKPGITVFGPGVISWWRKSEVIPPARQLPKERQFVDDISAISFTEFTIFETMTHDALYTVLAGGGKWSGEDPFMVK
ncbi:glycoside hydrolase family 9 protein [bacterium]|nr:glycoside hydrolase family 9 protein [bacterium]